MKVKTFDCVKMKHEIQQQILREWSGLSPQQQREKTEQLLESDPLLGPLWRLAKPTHPAAPNKDAAKPRGLKPAAQGDLDG